MFPGPLCSVLVNRFGCRPVMMVGGLLASLGMILASFSTSIIHIYLTTGVITGETTCSLRVCLARLNHWSRLCCRFGSGAEFPAVADYAQPLLQREASSGQRALGSGEPCCPVLPLTAGPGPTVPVRLEGRLPHPGWSFTQLLRMWGSDEAPGGPQDRQG